ncbi:hypothetical protein GGE45_003530 [Rhizobium aethiopicum]|uniref:Uncharacterized protein n=1 Tax=Rhizobium aethiopicum TaxID=1138170 RepID=A0A7W6MJK5_9HYPH|nr:hypothetical protein [Rhizobium aethiopicum]MBB4581188.1 hypothetical protein [Rhizobium aethiopicum]
MTETVPKLWTIATSPVLNICGLTAKPSPDVNERTGYRTIAESGSDLR